VHRWTLARIGARYGIGAERVRQICNVEASLARQPAPRTGRLFRT
jgi:DNA-directed RNA polymerase sigma subunit (sigma70/sigma32)